MLNVWKYGHLCGNLTFIRYLCENAQCVKIWPFVWKFWLSFDICVKIWLFLMCVQFLKSCVQFLMDTIVNPAIAQFLMKKNGDVLSGLCVSHLSKGRRTNEMRVSHLTKGRHVLWRRVSPLLNMQKKNTYRLFSMGFSLCQHAAWPLAHICARMCTNGHVWARRKKHRVEHKLSDIFEALRLLWV
jgi:hypothetical protein